MKSNRQERKDVGSAICVQTGLVLIAIFTLAMLPHIATVQRNVVKASTESALRGSRPPQQTASPPSISYGWFEGKKFTVRGANFSSGAVIWLNGVAQSTKNSKDNVDSILIAKKAGKQTPSDTLATMWVQNADGQISDKIVFYTGCSR